MLFVIVACKDKATTSADKRTHGADQRAAAVKAAEQRLAQFTHVLRTIYNSSTSGLPACKRGQTTAAKVLVVERDLIGALVVGKPKIELEGDSSRRKELFGLDGYLRSLSSPLFWSLVDHETSRLYDERLTAQHKADLIDQGARDTELLELVKTIDDVNQGALVVVELTTRTLPTFSQGAGLGTFKPGKVSGRATVFDIAKATPICAAPVRAKNSDVRTGSVDDIADDFLRNVKTAIVIATGVDATAVASK